MGGSHGGRRIILQRPEWGTSFVGVRQGREGMAKREELGGQRRERDWRQGAVARAFMGHENQCVLCSKKESDRK